MSDTQAGRRIGVGQVIQTATGLLSRNGRLFVILSALFAALPTALFGLLRVTGVVSDPGDDVGAAIRGVPGENIALSLAGLYLTATVIGAALEDLAGRRPGLNDSLTRAQGHFLTLFLIGLLANLAIIAGLLFLIVPGVLLYLRWCVAGAVRVSERTGVMESLGRSAVLTRGNRWVLLGLTLIAVAIFLALLAVGIVPFLLIGEGSAASLAVENLIVGPVLAAVAGLLGSVGTAAAYVELRRAHDGLPSGGVDEVFA